MIDEKHIRSSSRHSLQVHRYHVWPMLQEQRTDAHSLQMLRIYICIWGPPCPETSTYIVFHDAGEGDAGDFQFGAKRRWPKVKAALDECEEEQTELVVSTDVAADVRDKVRTALNYVTWCVDDTEKLRIKACDLIEGYEHASVDVAMGNRLAVPVTDAYRSGLVEHIAKMSPAERDRIWAYVLRPYGKMLRRVVEAARRDFGEADE